MFKNTDKEILDAYRKEPLKTSEGKYISSLFAENESNVHFRKHIKNQFEQDWDSEYTENYELDGLLDRIHHRMNLNAENNKRSLVQYAYQWYKLAAAVLLVPIIVAGGLWIKNEKNNQTEVLVENTVVSKIYAPMGARISFSLPDGTTGWLNSGSTLEYNSPFAENRKVELSGEAWFDVAHDKQHPFELRTGNSVINVLGTKFNVNAYPETAYTEVVLEEGKVAFDTPGIEGGIVMQPSERLVFNQGEIRINKVDTHKYSAWREGKLIFRGDSMKEVAQRIERWFNVRVELKDKELESYIIRGIFQDDSLEEVMRYLSMTSPMSFTIKERHEKNSGILTKRIVEIKVKKQTN